MYKTIAYVIRHELGGRESRTNIGEKTHSCMYYVNRYCSSMARKYSNRWNVLYVDLYENGEYKYTSMF